MRVIEPQEVILADGRRLLIRAAYPSDAPALLLGLERVAAEGGIGSQANIGQARELISRHKDRQALLLVAMDGGHLAGACGLSPEAAHVASLGMFVLPEWRGSGAAALILEMALAWAKDAGYLKVSLGVFASNGRAIGFYRKMGFSEEGHGAGDEVLMARDLR